MPDVTPEILLAEDSPDDVAFFGRGLQLTSRHAASPDRHIVKPMDFDAFTFPVRVIGQYWRQFNQPA